jgi:predicted permease
MNGGGREAAARVRAFFCKRPLDSDLDAELASHIAMATDDNIRSGMTPGEARRQAMLKFGGTEPAKELHRDARGLPWLDTVTQDLRYAFRTLRKDAAFTTFAVLIVAFGIGASSTVFSVVNALLLRPLPFADSERLAWVSNRDVAGLSGQTTQVGHFLDLKAQTQSFSDMAAYFAFYGIGDAKMTGSGEPERLTAVPVSGNFFPLLGVQPILGRNFTVEECKWRGPRAVMLSHGLWQRRFNADPNIAGRGLTIDEQPYVIAGVLPASFDFGTVFAPGTHVDLYIPFPLTPETNRWGNTLAIIGRLKPGVHVDAANAETQVIAKQLVEAHPRDRNGFGGIVKPLGDHVSGRVRVAVLVLAGAVGVVMLIVCANLSNLLLARTASRQKEIAVRTALGAGRGRLVRQLLTESMVLSCSGAALGLGLALAGTRMLSRMESLSIPMLRDVRTDATALAFILLMAIVTGLVFGVGPALQSKTGSLHDTLKDSTRGSTEGKRRNWVRGALVVSEVAFACVLLVGAGLLIRSFLRVLEVDLGFRPERAAAMRVDPGRQYDTPAKQNAYIDEVLRRVRETPGVLGAGISDALPLGRNRTWGVGAKGVQYERGRAPFGYVRVVSDGYFAAMGIPLRAGRDFTERDSLGTDSVIIINETMARTLWPGQEAIGQIMRADRERRVVGVVGDVRHLALEATSGNEFYLPVRQTGDRPSMDLVVRTTQPVATLASTVRAVLKPLQPDLPGNDFRTLQTLVDKAVSPRRFTVLLLAGFAAFALVLASLGIYGVISYSVGQRAQEIGIRMALGASAGQLQRKIVLQTLGLAGIGMAIGGTGAWLLARAMSTLLYGVKATDPATFVGMAAVLTIVAAVAGYLPARRASRMDPMLALRAD